MSCIAPRSSCMLDDEVLGFVTQDVDEGVADADDVEAGHATGRGVLPIVTGMPWSRRGRSRLPTVVTRP